MKEENIEKDKTLDNDLDQKATGNIFTRFFRKITSLIKSYFSIVKIIIKLYLKKIQQLFIEQMNLKNRKMQRKTDINYKKPSTSKIIPAVLKDTADIKNKVELFLQKNHEVIFGRIINSDIIKKTKAADEPQHNNSNISNTKIPSIPSALSHSYKFTEKTQDSMERKARIETISINSLENITQEILKNRRIQSFIEREMLRHSNMKQARAAI